MTCGNIKKALLAWNIRGNIRIIIAVFYPAFRIYSVSITVTMIRTVIFVPFRIVIVFVPCITIVHFIPFVPTIIFVKII
jgi:hypothetical protein